MHQSGVWYVRNDGMHAYLQLHGSTASLKWVLIFCRNSAGHMVDIEPGHARLACGQLLVVRTHYGSNVGLAGGCLVCILLGDLISNVNHGRECGKCWVRMIPANHPAAFSQQLEAKLTGVFCRH